MTKTSNIYILLSLLHLKPFLILRQGGKETQCPTSNYNYFGKPPSILDPGVFDIQAARIRLSEALGPVGAVPTLLFVALKSFRCPWCQERKL